MMNIIHQQKLIVKIYSSIYIILIFNKNILYYRKFFNKCEINCKKMKKFTLFIILEREDDI